MWAVCVCVGGGILNWTCSPTLLEIFVSADVHLLSSSCFQSVDSVILCTSPHCVQLPSGWVFAKIAALASINLHLNWGLRCRLTVEAQHLASRYSRFTYTGGGWDLSWCIFCRWRLQCQRWDQPSTPGYAMQSPYNLLIPENERCWIKGEGVSRRPGETHERRPLLEITGQRIVLRPKYWRSLARCEETTRNVRVRVSCFSMLCQKWDSSWTFGLESPSTSVLICWSPWFSFPFWNHVHHAHWWSYKPLQE